MIFIIMDPCYLEWCSWGPAPPILTFSRPVQGPEATHCKRQSEPGEPPWFPRLLEQKGQDLILRNSNMAALLKQLKIRENVGKGDVSHSIFCLCPILFFALYSIHPEGTVSQPHQIVSLCNSKEASTVDFETRCSVEKWGNCTVEINFCLSSLNAMICWPANDVMKPVDSPQGAQCARRYWWLLLQRFERIWKDWYAYWYEETVLNTNTYHSKV